MISEHYRCNTSCTILFLKTYGEETLDAYIRTIVVLTGGKLTEIYFLHLLSVTTHRRQGMRNQVVSSLV
jgi:hypothetical protein